MSLASNEHMKHISSIAQEDVKALEEAEKHYGGSWKRRGGVGAFMMLARKWDRLENKVQDQNWDIFECVEMDDRSEGIIDDIRDLRRYLMLVEAECRAVGWEAAQPK